MQRLAEIDRTKVVITALIAGVVAAAFVLGLPEHLTIDTLKHSQSRFQEFYGQHPVRMIALFAGIYIPVVALNIPGAVVLGLAAGALFGTMVGTVVVSFASTIGATLACLTSRYLLRDWVQQTFGHRFERVNEGIRAEGAFYLFSMRLIPVIPFFIINLVMGLTPIRLSTFYWVSQLGMLPATAIFVNAGSQIARIDALSGILSGQLMISLALLGIFPLAAKKTMAAWRRQREETTPVPVTVTEDRLKSDPVALTQLTATMKKVCTRCGICVANCAFLDRYGNPGDICATIDPNAPEATTMAYTCSLCGLCYAVCPEKLDPGAYFLALRSAAVDGGRADLAKYRTILGYEKKGTSALFSYYALPPDCDTIFFPGCTLPGTRPDTTWKLFEYLRRKSPNLGIVLDCCTKPSHDLGRKAYFGAMFGEMVDYLRANGIRRVWLACPNCHKVFSNHAHGLTVESVYEVIDRMGLPEAPDQRQPPYGHAEMVIHDPCPMRTDTAVQASVRSLMTKLDIPVGKMAFQREKTLCCGEGGSVGVVDADLARTWVKKRKKLAKGRPMVTYCAGCAGFLGRVTPTLHIADLLFAPDNSGSGRFAVAKAPFTYLNRLAFKRRLKRSLRATRTRVRRFSAE